MRPAYSVIAPKYFRRNVAPAQYVISALHVAPRRELPDQLGIDRGLEFEIKALQSLLEREARHRDPHLMMFMGFRPDLSGEQLVEEVGVGNFLFRRLFQARGKFVLDLIQAQPMAVVAQTFDLWCHRVSSPSLRLTASYSARSRTITSPSCAKWGSQRGAASGARAPTRNSPA